MEVYLCLKQQEFSIGEYKLVPIRFEDRYEIMRWRNEQLYHLRQKEPLTIQQQDDYFENVISKLFYQKEPNQILFSFLKNDLLIGYGGLVHINWIDKNAEISFIMDTQLEDKWFQTIWSSYLNLIDKIAFEELKLHKVSTFAYDLRPNIYTLFEKANYKREAVLLDHKFFDDHFVNIVIHAKIRPYE
jgi:RimJ/RimL family protein N-acetyltransferase